MPGPLNWFCDTVTRFYNSLCCRDSSVISSSRASDLPRQVVKVKTRTFPDVYYQSSSSSRSTVSPGEILPELNINSSSVASSTNRGSRTYRVDDDYSSDFTSCSSSSVSSSSIASTRSSHATWEYDIDDADEFTKFRALTFMEKLRRKPVTHILGHTNQKNIGGDYAGKQCTMMALTAVSYHTYRPMGFWTSSTIDDMVMYGNYYHEYYRGCGYSTNPDGRIALDELPTITRLAFDNRHDEEIPIQAFVGEQSGVLFLGQTNMTRGLNRPSLREHLEEKTADLDEAAFVITVGQFSYGIVKAKDGYWYLYDSHGSLLTNSPVFEPEVVRNGWEQGATLTRFETLEMLYLSLKDNHAPGTACDARLVTVIPPLNLSFCEEQKPNPERKIRRSAMSIFPRIRCTSTAPPIIDPDVDDVGLEDTIDLQ